MTLLILNFNMMFKMLLN